MWTALWTGLAEWALARTRMFWLAAGFGFACFLFGGCVGCEVERHRPHWFGAIGCGRAASPRPPLAVSWNELHDFIESLSASQRRGGIPVWPDPLNPPGIMPDNLWLTCTMPAMGGYYVPTLLVSDPSKLLPDGPRPKHTPEPPVAP